MRLRTALPWIVLMLASYLTAACHTGQASPSSMVTIPAGGILDGQHARGAGIRVRIG